MLAFSVMVVEIFSYREACVLHNNPILMMVRLVRCLM